jgi:CheY-like chemotaxis protein
VEAEDEFAAAGGEEGFLEPGGEGGVEGVVVGVAGEEVAFGGGHEGGRWVVGVVGEDAAGVVAFDDGGDDEVVGEGRNEERAGGFVFGGIKLVEHIFREKAESGTPISFLMVRDYTVISLLCIPTCLDGYWRFYCFWRAPLIRVVIADDFPAVRRGIRTMLERMKGIEVVGEAVNGREAVERVEQVTPDVVVMDVSMPQMDGIEATERIHQSGAATRILMVSVYKDASLVRQALEKGARGYMLKDSLFERLGMAIEMVAAGETYLDDEIVTILKEDTGSGNRAVA